MKEIIIPADIKEYVNKKVFKKISLWLIMTIAITLLIVFFGDTFFSRLNNTVKVGLYVLLLIIPVFISKPYELKDNSFYGLITKIEVKNTVDSERGFRPTIETLYRKETVYFYIKLKNGKTIKRKAFEQHANNNNMSKYYSVGDRVLHIYGTDYLQIINKNVDKKICVICGTSNPAANDSCAFCRHTLNIRIDGPSISGDTSER